MSTAEAPVQFEPLIRRGLILGLRTAQVLLMAGGVVAGLAIVGATRSIYGGIAAALLVIAAVALGLATWGRRNWDQWLVLGGRWLWRAVRGRNHWVSRYPLMGILQYADGEQVVLQDPPPMVKGVEILELPLVSGGDAGVIREADGDSLVVVFRTSGSGFMFSDTPEQRAAVRGLGAVWERLGQRETAFTGAQILERSLAALGDSAAQQLAGVPADRQRGAAFESYRELVEFQASSRDNAAQEHDVFVALRWSARRASKRIARAVHGARAGKSVQVSRQEWASRQERATLKILLEDVVGIEEEITGHGHVTPNLVSARGVAAIVRQGFNPAIRGTLHRRSFLEQAEPGLAPALAWPLECQTEWDRFHTEGVWHRTYWIREWPVLAQSWDWIGGLLLRTGVGRTLSVVMRPVDPEVALARAGGSQTLDEAAVLQKERRGFRIGDREKRQLGAARRREQLLGQGRAAFVFSGYLSVSAPDELELESRCERVRAEAVKSRIELQLLVAQQDEAFVWGALPMVRGVRPGRV